VSQSAVRQPIPVGKYFLDRGKITQQQLELALRHRGEFGLKLGQSLVELGFVTESDMMEALRHQARFPCVHLTSGIVDARVAARLSEATSRRLKALALNQIADHTTVALEDPSDPQALEELASVLGAKVFPVYAEPSAIVAFLDLIFGTAKGRSAAAQPAVHAPAAPALAPAPAPPEPAHVPPAPAPAAAALAPRSAPAHAIDAPARERVPAAPPDDRAVVDCVRGFLQRAFERRASDIHLEARRDELVVRFRAGGALHDVSRLPGSWAQPTIACLKALAQIDGGRDGEDGGDGECSSRGALEGRIPFVFRKQSYEVHVATLSTMHGESAVLHVVGGERARRDLEDLGLAEEQLATLETILAAREGLLTVAGPAGSGRSTTLNALVARLATRDRKVVALAEPLVSELDGVLYVRADPRDGLAPEQRFRVLLRQDPDVLVVPAIDGPETARALLEAALAGRSVLATQHARGALESLARLVHLGLESHLLSDAVRGVVSQRLLRRVCDECRALIVPDEALCARLDVPRDGNYFEGEGCAACHGSGFSGRIALFEVLGMTGGLRRELERGADLQALARAARAEGFTSLREHGLRQARAGLTTLHEVLIATAGG
jgi:type IV pilus assembly protein PilB